VPRWFTVPCVRDSLEKGKKGKSGSYNVSSRMIGWKQGLEIG